MRTRSRILTIASMRAPGLVRIEQVANMDQSFEVYCPSLQGNTGTVRVTRSHNGRAYEWDTDTDHIRIFIKMEGPDDLPFISGASRGAGWFQLEGFPRRDLGTKPIRTTRDHEIENVEELAGADFSEIEDVVRIEW